MKKVVFIDLDGTLIEPISQETFPKGIWDMRIKFEVWNSLKNFVEQNHTKYIMIVTNQGGIETGYVDRDYWYQKFKYIQFALQDFLEPIDDVVVMGEFCETNDTNDSKRKPNTGMLEDLSWIRGLHLSYKKSEMLMIGDASGKHGDFSDTDKKTAENFGIDYMDINDLIWNYHPTIKTN